MIPWNEWQRRVGPVAFSRGCMVLATVWLLVIYPALILVCPKRLPELMAPLRHVDVYQYYAGGVAVRDGLWDSLYPIPLPNLYTQPNHFTPKYRTFLFNPATAAHETAFYPELNSIEGSQWNPKLKAAFPEAQSYSYIYPPPTALLCAPMALFSFDTASNRVWPIISVWFLFVMAYYSARIQNIIRGGASYAEGIATLACIVYTTQGETHIPDGNVSPILGGCIAACAYALIRNRMLVFSCCYIVLVLFKSIGLTWLPLLLLNRRYWRAIPYLAVIAVVLNGIVWYFGGTKVYQTFFSLAPLISIPVGVGLVETVMHDFGFFSLKFYAAIEVILLGFLYYGFWKSCRADAERRPLYLSAFLAGTMAIFCLLNFIVWSPYCAVYLFFPFLGWMSCEITLAQGIRRKAILAGVIVGFAVLNGEGLCYLLFGQKAWEFYSFSVSRFYVMLIPAFFLVVSLRRLLFQKAVEAPRSIARQPRMESLLIAK